VVQAPGPKKINPLPLAELEARVAELTHRDHRTFGAPALAGELSQRVSTRQVAQCVAACRRERRRVQRQACERVEWTAPNVAWSLDGSETLADEHHVKLQFVAFQDLASRYRLAPFFALALAGRDIAAHLEQLFRQYGAPLFLKRDNGSNLNSAEVNAVLAGQGVIPLNSPAYYPRYNGAMENGIGQFKKHLLPCLVAPPRWDLDTVRPLGRALVVELNARRRRSLAGETPATVFHAGGPTWTKRFRQETFQWIESHWWATVARMEQPNHRQIATAWRLEAVAWLRCQGLIRCSTTPTVLPHSRAILCT
jgi:transposase InsO family protein